jgi:heat shock protein HslJ
MSFIVVACVSGGMLLGMMTETRSIHQRWWRRTALHPLSGLAFGFVALITTTPAQPQEPPILNLLGTEWLLEDLGGSGVIDNAQATLSFAEHGKVTGKGSCNGFFGSVEIKGDLVSIGSIGATRMQCAEAVSNQEQRYLIALEAADRIWVDGFYLFVHSKLLEKPLRFMRLQKQ